MNLDPRALDRLAKVCGMFGSDQFGERAAAAQRAETIRQQLGVSWADLLSGARGAHETGAGRSQPPAFDPMTASPAAIAARCGPILTEWERDFLASIAGQPCPFSPKQRDRFRRIRVKCAEWSAHGGGA